MKRGAKRACRLIPAILLAGSSWATAVRADYASAVLADNPIGYWRFDDTGDTAVNAGTEGSALDGSYVGGQLVPNASFTLIDGRTVNGLGSNNRAFEVGNELDEYMSVPESILSDRGEFTLEAWVYPGPRNGNRIGLFGQNDAVEFGFIGPNQIQLWTPAGQVLNYVIDPVNELPDETWFHLAAVADGERIRMFINGEPLSRGPSYGEGNFNFNIGGGGIYDTTGNQFTGSVDEVSIWNRALTESQLQGLVTAGKSVGGDYSAAVLSQNPLGYWDMDDAAGDVATNRGTGGAGLNGTYVGGDRSVNGPEESYGGFGNDNQAFGAEAPEDGYITVPGSPLRGLGEFTLAGWVKPGTIIDNRVGLFGQNDTIEFGLIDPNTIQLWTPNGGFVNFTLNGEVAEDEWVHIAAVGTGDELQIYVDGELMTVGGTSLVGNPIASYGASDFPFNVGGGGIYDASGNQFEGRFDEVAVYDRALTDAQIKAHFEAALGGGGIVGDFNGNGQLDADDLDRLATGMQANDAAFDLDGDNDADLNDRRFWVNDLKRTYMGDSNLDGEFNSGDLVAVFVAGKFESGAAATWADGDWNGDKLFNSSDFVEAFQGGGYELGPRGAVAAVPEPSGLALMFASLLGLARRRRN